MHLIVLIMAAGILVMTSIRVELGVFGLAVIMPFSRPGFTLGDPKLFHISGFNVALIGVFLAYTLRYFLDDSFAEEGPFIRGTKVDALILLFGALFVFSALAAFNYNETIYQRMMLGLSIKNQILQLLWFYMLVSIMRKPEDVRNLVVAFAIAGFLAASFGMFDRISSGGGQISAGTQSEELAVGAGGRLQGGWFGLGHPNMFGGLLLLTMPFWFFMVSHLERVWQRLAAEAAVVIGFLGLLFTYSRSAWLGSLAGLGLIGLADKNSLKRIVLFGLLFAVIAQGTVFLTTGQSLVDVVVSRFEQLEESDFSSRPEIYISAAAVVRSHPWLGVGPGMFRYHAPPTPDGLRPQHAHNVFYQFAGEAGVPAAVIFVIFFLVLINLARKNLRIVQTAKGYAFIALGAGAAIIAITAQMMAVEVFQQEILGFAIYALAAVIVTLDRMRNDGLFDAVADDVPAAGTGR
jgi:O-antigen ligase